MSSFDDGKIWKAKSDQTLLLNSGERVSADPDKMSTIGVAVGQQIRITNKDNDELALFTFAEEKEETYEYNLRAAYNGRARLGETDTPLLIEVDSVVPHPTYDAAEAEANDEFIEELDERESSTSDERLCVIAPHGGIIENYTDEQAELVFATLNDADKDVDCWRCKGWKAGGGGYTRWHITSTEIDRRSFPKLDSIADKGFDYCVSFHGYSEDDVLVGGAAPSALKNEIKEAIEEALDGTGIDVLVVDSGPYAGTDPDNLVNWLCGGEGVQVEQSYEARRDHWQVIAEAVAGVFSSKL